MSGDDLPESVFAFWHYRQRNQNSVLANARQEIVNLSGGVAVNQLAKAIGFQSLRRDGDLSRVFE
jgi:hypothetical protein